MNRLRALRSLVSGGINSERNDSAKASVLVGLLDVEGPDIVRIKKGVDAGKEISLLKMMIGSPDGTVCKVTVWRELAEIWGDSLRRGDVTLLQGSPYSHKVGWFSFMTRCFIYSTTGWVVYVHSIRQFRIKGNSLLSYISYGTSWQTTPAWSPAGFDRPWPWPG